jgi:1-acyl-sn-glycerol-3-phosphate acyltransferase
MVTMAVSVGLLLRDPHFFKRMQRHWARGLTWFWGVELKVFGAENLAPARSYVVMSNHLSYADIVALFLALPVIPGFLAKSELRRVPFLNAALDAGGHVVIERRAHDKAMQSIDSAAAQVRGGRTVLIFPEGTRGDSDTIGDFKSGGFRLAKAAGVPIVPVGLRGTRAVGPRHSILFYPGTIEVHIGQALPVEQVEALEFRELVTLVRGSVMELSAMPARESGQA